MRPRRSLGGCDLRSCRHSRGPLGGPAEVRLTHHYETSPFLGGLRSAKLSPLSWAPGRPSG
eukprot:4010831-Pyramimonas_sp.AAC.1